MATAALQITGVKGSKKFSLSIDTGSLYTWLSGSALSEIGVVPTSQKKFRRFDGKTVTRNTGEAIMELQGEKAFITVVFSERGEPKVLGFAAIQALGLELDFRTRTLRKTPFLAPPIPR